MPVVTSPHSEALVLRGIGPEFHEWFLDAMDERRVWHSSDDGDLELPSPLVLHQVSWDFYEAFLEATHNQRIRHSYDDGELEIMSPMRTEHENPKKRLARLIETLTEELEIPILCVGSLTLRDRQQAKGLEPDECFYIARESSMRRKTSYDPSRDPAPDLAIEVDWTSSSVPRLPLYATLGVPEVWHYANGQLTVLLLQPTGEYAASEQSLAFPMLPLSEFLHFVPATSTWTKPRGFARSESGFVNGCYQSREQIGCVKSRSVVRWRERTRYPILRWPQYPGRRFAWATATIQTSSANSA